MTDDEQILEAIAQAFGTLSERLSKELEDAFNQMAQLMGRAQKQQYEIVALFGKQAAAMKALADLLAKVRNDDIERRNEHATAIEQLSRGQMKIAQFADSLATQYGQLFKAVSNRLDAVEKEAFGPVEARTRGLRGQGFRRQHRASASYGPEKDRRQPMMSRTVRKLRRPLTR
jgi:methyl-accepting chemotaxis protein